jgi:hypothetical protein
LQDAANAKNEEADMKKQEASEKRAAADQKQKEAIDKRAAADTKQQEADVKKAKAQKTRDSMLGSITDMKKKKKARLLADAAINGGNVTKVKANITAANETAACDDLYLNMGINSTVGACEVNVTNVLPDRRHLLADAAYLVEVLLSSTEVNRSDIDAALTSLSVAGINAESTKEDALVLLSIIPGIAKTILTTLRSDATAAAAAIGTAAAAEADAIATESAAAKLETDATAAEKTAVDLAAEAIILDNKAAVAAAMLVPPPPPPLSPPERRYEESSNAATRSSWALQWVVLWLVL